MFNLRPQNGNVPFNSVLNHGQVDAGVVVNNQIAHPLDLLPGDIGVLLLKPDNSPIWAKLKEVRITGLESGPGSYSERTAW